MFCKKPGRYSYKYISYQISQMTKFQVKSEWITKINCLKPVLLMRSLFLPPSFLGGKKKGGKNNQMSYIQGSIRFSTNLKFSNILLSFQSGNRKDILKIKKIKLPLCKVSFNTHAFSFKYNTKFVHVKAKLVILNKLQISYFPCKIVSLISKKIISHFTGHENVRIDGSLFDEY